MTKNLTTLVVLALVSSALCVSTSLAQDENSIAASSLTAAKELSAASGRPIFAIAGRST